MKKIVLGICIMVILSGCEDPFASRRTVILERLATTRDSLNTLREIEFAVRELAHARVVKVQKDTVFITENEFRFRSDKAADEYIRNLGFPTRAK